MTRDTANIQILIANTIDEYEETWLFGVCGGATDCVDGFRVF